jgi:hypothetical protein
MKHRRPRPNVRRVATVIGAASVALMLAAPPSSAAFLCCDTVRMIIKDCIGPLGGAEQQSCQPEVDALAAAVGPQPLYRAAACLCVHDIEDHELHYYPNRDVAALNRRLAVAGLYSWDCVLLVAPARERGIAEGPPGRPDWPVAAPVASPGRSLSHRPPEPAPADALDGRLADFAPIAIECALTLQAASGTGRRTIRSPRGAMQARTWPACSACFAGRCGR